MHLTRVHVVPSGHILTKEELQVLGAMLATYSDEKLKSIQLSLQEEQEIRDISREEVEKFLRQSGLASMADGLKDVIEKGIAWSWLSEAGRQGRLEPPHFFCLPFDL